MQVFSHHLYEYKKGLRSLILHTTDLNLIDCMINKLKQNNIDYIIYKVNNIKVNIFFGDKACIDVIKKINKNSLTCYTPEEDFILGIMLGYSRIKQCSRYLQLKENIKKDPLIG